MRAIGKFVVDVQASFQDAVPFSFRLPASELAGYFRWSLAGPWIHNRQVTFNLLSETAKA
jgi:hypothetical protein